MANKNPIPRHRRARLTRARGLTLIEILAVVVIIGVVSAAVMLSMHVLDSRSDQGQVAEKLAGLIELASEDARLENVQYGLMIKPQGYEFMRFNGTDWTPVSNDPTLAARALPNGMQFAVSVQNPIHLPLPATAAASVTAAASATGPMHTEQAPTPQIAILSTGEMTPFTLRLSTPDGTTYVVRGGGSGRVHVVPPGSSAPAAATD